MRRNPRRVQPSDARTHFFTILVLSSRNLPLHCKLQTTSMRQFQALSFLLEIVGLLSSPSKWQRRSSGATIPVYSVVPQLAPMLNSDQLSFSMRNPRHINFDGKFETMLFNEWKHTTADGDTIIQSFIFQVMLPEIPLTSGVLMGPVLDAISHDPTSTNIAHAVSIWSYLRRSIHKIKPCQVLFSKMMTIYLNPFGRVRQNIVYHQRDRQICVVNAAKLTDEWVHEYQVDKESLQV